MARFYGSMKGARGSATRCGTASSGFTAHIRGWNIGARVTLAVDADGNDVVYVERTGGSNGSTGATIATLRASDLACDCGWQNHPTKANLLHTADCAVRRASDPVRS